MVDFNLGKLFLFRITTMHPKTLRAIWGLTLPEIFESSPDQQTEMVQEIGSVSP
jgi:hypothetical protein